MSPIRLLLCCLPLSAFAQQQPVDSTFNYKHVTPYDPHGNVHTWSIKGKTLPWFLGNSGGISGMLGLEYGFTKNQSIGIDAFVEFTEASDDNVQDTAGVKHDIGDYYHSAEKAIFFNYRYYFNFRKLRDRHGITPYIVCFLRYGKLDQHYDPLYRLDKFMDNYEKHTSAGILIGSIFQFKNPDRLGIDVNLGVFEKQKDITTVYLKNGATTTTYKKPLAPGFRLSVNLMYWFFCRSSH